MSTAIPCDTADAIGSTAAQCESRSLFASRFADPTSKEDARKVWFQNLIGKKSISRAHWHPPTANLLHAQLKSRLVVNMAGGVMENAGINLDRYGLPYIPGSAVKGCARRAALAALSEWCGTDAKPEGDDNLFAKLCAGFSTSAELLSTIARTFGWVETDWSEDKNKNGTWQSDFAWACAPTMDAFNAAASQLGTQKQFAGIIAFLDARPNSDPGLVLDVLTPHHKDYYEGKLKTATDTEEPVPVFFPAVKEQGEYDHFTFPLVPLRRADESLLTFVQEALRAGLEVFGIGAKTNAGYGWFDASLDLNSRLAERQKEAIERKRELERQTAEKARLEAEAKARADAKAALAAALEGLTPEQQEDKKLELLSDAQFDAKVRAFCKEPKKGGPTEPEKQAIVRALRGPRLEYWQTFKTKATKGDLATVDQAIRQLSKTLNLGKMP
jgi:CRISPR-associated protein Cmr6